MDGNATRVFARIEEIYEDVLKPQTIRQVTDIIRAMMPDGQAGALTEAIMELGALSLFAADTPVPGMPCSP